MTDGVVRLARAEEAGALSALAMRSKAHWGYSQEFLEIVRPMLTFSQADLTNDPVYVLEGPQGPIGMYRLLDTPPQGTLEDLWVDPEAIGSGMGRRLFEHALVTAAGIGLTSLLIESDPIAPATASARRRRSSAASQRAEFSFHERLVVSAQPGGRRAASPSPRQMSESSSGTRACCGDDPDAIKGTAHGLPC